MSNENDDIEPGLQPGLQESAPITADGTAAGSTDVLSATQAFLTGEPDTLPPTWCKKCKATVVPAGKGTCPRCGVFLRLNFVSRRHPVNKLRVQQLIETFVQEYRPNSQRFRSMCEQLAIVTSQLETTKPGSPDHQRLVQLSVLLGEQLEGSRSTTTAADVGDLSEMTIDQLLERTELIYCRLTALRDEQPPVSTPSPFDTSPIVNRQPAPLDSPDPEAGVSPAQTEISVPGASSAAEPGTSEPDPCRFCHQSIARCAEIKNRDVDTWRALHHLDPDEVQRRKDRATAEMMRPGASRLPDWYTRR